MLLACRTKHGHAKNEGTSRTYITWMSMHSRCGYTKNVAYARYGGRGISVDPAWADFRVFLTDMGERPEGRSLDRIDNAGHYTKINCRWATPLEQTRNRRPRGTNGN